MKELQTSLLSKDDLSPRHDFHSGVIQWDNSTVFISSSFFVCVVESSLSGKTHPSTPAMYKFRPSFGTMPKVHYHAAGEKVRLTVCSFTLIEKAAVAVGLSSHFST